jgi:hypothetical protein
MNEARVTVPEDPRLDLALVEYARIKRDASLISSWGTMSVMNSVDEMSKNDAPCAWNIPNHAKHS